MRIYEGEGPTSEHFLDRLALVDGTSYTKIAYIVKIESSSTSDNKPFYRISFNDQKGDRFIGRLFNVADYEDSGRKVKQLKGRVAKISFEAKEFMGEIQGNLTSIDAIPEDKIPVHFFIGKIENRKEYFDNFLDQMNALSASRYKHFVEVHKTNNSFIGIEDLAFDLYNRKQGGYIKFISKFLDALNIIDEGDLRDRAKTIVIFWASMATRRMKTEMSPVTKIRILSDIVSVFDRIAKAVNTEFNNRFIEEAILTIQALYDLAPPDTYVSKTVNNIYRTLYDNEVMCDINNNLIVDGYKFLENGERLTKLLE